MPNKPLDRYLVVPNGAVKTSGYSADLAKGQIGLFDVDPSKVGRRGAPAIESIVGAKSNYNKYEVRLGVEDRIARTLSNKSAKTLPFKLNDVVKAWVSEPQIKEQKFDEWYIGYDGFDESKSLVFKPGESFQLDLVVWGKPLGYMTLNKSKNYIARHTIQIDENFDGCLEEDGCEPVDCAKYTLEAVEDLSNHITPTGEKLSRYFYIAPLVKPKEEVETTPYSLYELEYCGSNDGNEIGKVQAQYPDVEIVRDPLSLKFQMLLPTADGAPEAYKTTLPNLIPGCEGCPEGYSEIAGGYAYIVQLEDNGEDKASDISDSIPNVVSDSVVKLAQTYDIGYYIALSESKMTEEEIEEFLTGQPTASISYAGEKDAVCSSDEEMEFEWVKTAEGQATVKTFEIVLGDDCNGSRLEELQEVYPDLTIEEVETPAPNNCIRKYSAKVPTNIVFPEGCPNADVLQDVYTAEPPRTFDVNAHWIEVSEENEEGSVCGIYIKAKPVVINAQGECLIDELPFMATSMRVKPAGGYITNTYLNAPIVNRPFATLQVERGQDLDNLGGNIRGFERQGRYYFQNEKYMCDVYGRTVLGLENQLDGLTRYSFYSFQIDKTKHAQSFGGKVLESIVYHMITPSGKSDGVEKLLQTIAGAAGVVVEYK